MTQRDDRIPDRTKQPVRDPYCHTPGRWHWTQCLGWRLVLLLGGCLLVVMGTSSWLALRLHRQHLVSTLEERATDLSGTLLSATWSSMLENDRDHLQQIVTNVAESERVRVARLTSASGEIRYSSRLDEIGTLDRIDRPACQACHANGSPRVPESVADGTRTYAIDGEQGALGVAVPVLNAPECWSSGCHVHGESQNVLGVLDVELSTASMEAALASERRQLLVLALVTLVLVTTIPGLLTWRLVHIPLHQIFGTLRRFGQGDLEARLPHTFQGEMAELADSYNYMADELVEAQNELKRWGRTLEDRVEEKTEELARARDQMVFAEKMVSLGKLAAIVAHEINNPLAGILVSVKLMRRRIGRLIADDGERKKVDETLAMVERETARSGDIVRNLLLFSRQRELSMDEEDLGVILRRALALVGHKAELQGIELVEEIEDGLPTCVCDGNQIEQAVLAAVLNAIDAMPDGGTLTVRARIEGGERVRIEIADTGIGIPDELKRKIFEPFFTTKTEGQGTGLGLSVLYGIVQRHQGEVDFQSEVGRGTTFVLDIPLRPASETVPATGPDEEAS